MIKVWVGRNYRPIPGYIGFSIICIFLGVLLGLEHLVGELHLAKGLEFRAVSVIACDDQIIPLQQRIENAADETELEEV
ncbi:hypothetical protein [Desulfosporosinus nitroreducens]|uniref:hypothetical protein n=1 Tax=Desulfosporosinus nitroreducens TaxID=2018668 RepID=UPI00207D0CFD|nr:hypothetical protein [Desulfosporosinus nitroreducens]MCO1602410.1 hypothetical protein [Desulfosporosinus nitroreducens]